jgi:hypothetical protein
MGVVIDSMPHGGGEVEQPKPCFAGSNPMVAPAPAYPQRGSSSRRSASSVLTTSVLILPCSSTYRRVAFGAPLVIAMVGCRGIHRSNLCSSTTSSWTLANPSARRFAARENPLHVMRRPNWAPTSVNPAKASTCVTASFRLNHCGQVSHSP